MDVINPVSERRIGDFEITYISIDKFSEIVCWIFSIFPIIPVRAEYLIASNVIRYTAYCYLFDPISDGELIPYYNIFVNCDENGDMDVTAKREEDIYKMQPLDGIKQYRTARQNIKED